MIEGVGQFSLGKVLTKVDDGVLEVAPAIRVLTVPGGPVIKHVISFPAEMKEKKSSVSCVSVLPRIVNQAKVTQ